MTTPRAGHTATLLPDGRVLIAGGAVLDTAELYDPKARTFTRTGDLVVPEFGHAATLLNDGKVFLRTKPRFFDPVTAMFTAATRTFTRLHRSPIWRMGTVRTYHAAIQWQSLITCAPSTELYDPGTGTFSLAGAMATGRGAWFIGGRAATLLRSGQVLLTGGEYEDIGNVFAEAELYDPVSGKFTAVHKMIKQRSYHTATLLRDRTVLIAGAAYFGSVPKFGAVATTELYDPATDTFTPTPD